MKVAPAEGVAPEARLEDGALNGGRRPALCLR